MRPSSTFLQTVSVALLVGAGCSAQRNEGLVMLDVAAAAEIPAFTMVRFSVEGRPEVHAREVPYDRASPLRFGYYLPGPSGKVMIRAAALLSSTCVVGEGISEVEVQVGRISPAVPLQIARIKVIDPACRDAADGSTDQAPDAASDAASDDATRADAVADGPIDRATSDVRATSDGGTGPSDVMAAETTMPPPPPACMAAVQRCPGALACCSPLRCGTTTAGQVCCGDFNAGCTLPGGEDCCGQLECFHGRCCLPPVYFCAGHEGECCEGRICGNTSAGHVCCGLAGAACTRPGGEDCCGALECRNGRCAP